jgi:hypothetical protein
MVKSPVRHLDRFCKAASWKGVAKKVALGRVRPD